MKGFETISYEKWLNILLSWFKGKSPSLSTYLKRDSSSEGFLRAKLEPSGGQVDTTSIQNITS